MPSSQPRCPRHVVKEEPKRVLARLSAAPTFAVAETKLGRMSLEKKKKQTKRKRRARGKQIQVEKIDLPGEKK